MTWPTFPDIDIEAMEWTLLSNTQTHTSPLSGAEDTLELPGARWMASLTISEQTRLESRALEAFLVALRGAAGRFYFWHAARPTILGSGAGAPMVNGAGQLGASLATQGWTPNGAGVLLAGDYIGVGGELKMVKADVNASAGGTATVPIEPPLRYAPANGSALVLVKPKAVFRLVDDRQATFRYSGALGGYQIQIVETF